ncbi:MAG: protein phosphatase CheZ [Hyphomicrobiales bacterium]|nr:protein phosphatase CheZ [Hyphomicrobiales bacterium]
MTTTPAPITPLPLEDYDAIEAAVMETQRGRWFLAEYARRNRNSDTDQVLTALERIERTLRRDRAAPDIDRIRLDLADMAEAISRTKLEIAQMKIESEEGGRFAEASQELDAIVGQTEAATNDILLAAEGIQEAAWTLREDGASAELCDKLDTHATDVYTACSFQDLTGQRTRKVVTVLRYLESRINAMIDIWGLQEDDAAIPVDAPFDPMDARPDAHLLNGPQLAGRGVDQDQVDDLMWAQSNEIAFEAAGAMPEMLEEEAHEETSSAEPVAHEPLHEPTADVFEATSAADLDYAAADVFSSEDASRLAADHRAPLAEEPATPTIVTVALGATLATIAVAAEAAADAQPALSLVTAVDPIAEMSAERRLITFG